MTGDTRSDVRVPGIVGGTIGGQLKRAARSAGNTPDGSDTPSDFETGEEVLLPMMVPQPADTTPEPHGELFAVSRTIPAPPIESRHWYVDASDAPGYCAACGTPEHNRRRHVARRVV